MDETKKELSELLGRHDLLRSVLLAGKIPDAHFNLETVVEKVMAMASRVWSQAGQLRHDPIFVMEAIRKVVFDEEKILGKGERTKQVFDDPNRYFLHTVIDRKQGSNLTLCLLYSILADQLGIAHEIVALPSHFFLRIPDVGAGEFYVDPYDSGNILSSNDFQRKFRSSLQRSRMLSTSLFEKVKSVELVGKLYQQLKHIYILKGSALEALRAVELLTILYPESPELSRDRGILYCEMEYFSKAINDLKFYLKARPKADDTSEIKKLTSMIRGYREIVN